MGEYGSGVSLTQAFNYDKERLLHALKGELLWGESEEGFIYEEASEEECRKFIIDVFDNAVYHALQGYSSGRVYEKVLEANGIKPSNGQIFKDFLHFKQMDDLQQFKGEQYNYGDPENPEDWDDMED